MVSDAAVAQVFSPLAPPQRANAQRLVQMVLRNAARADAQLRPLVAKMPPGRAGVILRLAVVELAHDPDGAHGIVNDAVSLCAAHKKSAPFKGLVNAVLRKITKGDAPDWARLPANRLPKWIRGPLVQTFGPKATAAIEAAHDAPPPTDITPKDPLMALALANRLGADLLPGGSVRIHSTGQISTLSGFEDGQWWVQDMAAATPVRLLGDLAGKTVLDLCAAPGGKTLQLAAAGASVTAVDISARRLDRVRENLARTGLAAQIVESDALAFTRSGFDIVLLDAPCSATGTIRRHPDLPFAKTPADLAALTDLQAQLLDHALTLLAPGGQLMYVTCSLLPAEGEAQIDAALARHPDLELASFENLPAEMQGWQNQTGMLRLRPDYLADQGGMDGFFIALLQRR
jgi:16S rRNA (cytosine967-C5)-methyltransferase